MTFLKTYHSSELSFYWPFTVFLICELKTSLLVCLINFLLLPSNATAYTVFVFECLHDKSLWAVTAMMDRAQAGTHFCLL